MEVIDDNSSMGSHKAVSAWISRQQERACVEGRMRLTWVQDPNRWGNLRCAVHVDDIGDARTSKISQTESVSTIVRVERKL